MDQKLAQIKKVLNNGKSGMVIKQAVNIKLVALR
jgi:hypothetical protein